MAEAYERVAAGAAWLDEVKPGWVDEINLSKLKIGSTRSCVLAQLVSNVPLEDRDDRFNLWMDERNGAPVEAWSQAPAHISYEKAIDMGFEAYLGGWSDYDELQDQWEQLINERRENANA